MKDAVVFINSKSDAELATKYFNKAKVFRLTLFDAKRLKANIPSEKNVWIDCGVDGLLSAPIGLISLLESPGSTFRTLH